MELCKATLHRKQQKGEAVSQITLDDDYNVPDYRPDIVKILKEKGELRFDEVKGENGAVWLKGSLIFKVLYRNDKEEGKISSLRGEIPFQEKLNLDGVMGNEALKVKGEIEDVTIGVINSRKLNVRAVVLLKVQAEEEVDEELTCGVKDAEQYEQDITQKEALRLLLSGRDTCRQKSEVVLPSSKPNVREILWRSLELRNVDGRLKDGNVAVTGEILLSVLYSEEEGERLQWFETTIPLEGAVECGITEADVICQVKARPTTMELEVKPDYDGEERIFVLELVLELDMSVWKEEQFELLSDIYSLQKQVTPVWEMGRVEHLLIKNSAKGRITEQMELTDGQEKILQICACEGNIVIEKKEMTTEGLQVEGVVNVELLYITTEDDMPVGNIREVYPFSQVVEIPEQEGEIRMDAEASLEQLSAAMLDQEHIEVKAVIRIDLLAFREEEIQNIKEIEEEPLDMEKLQEAPGLIGYIAREGDSLFRIARENHTTIRDIMEANGLKEEKLNAGDKLLIVKRIFS